MSDTAPVAARARGLATRALPVARAGDLDAALRARAAADHASLARWSRALVPLWLDEDRRSLRAIARGLAANAPIARRLAATVPTPLLSARRLVALAAAPSFAALAALTADHPLGPLPATGDLLALELWLSRRFAARARTRDRALRTYVTQVIDVENAATALLLPRAPDAFLPGGERIDRATFERGDRGQIAAAFARTPIATALFAAAPSAIEDAALAWQLATQHRLRRTEPLGLAPVVYLVLVRRDEARHLQRAAWRSEAA